MVQQSIKNMTTAEKFDLYQGVLVQDMGNISNAKCVSSLKGSAVK